MRSNSLLFLFGVFLIFSAYLPAQTRERTSEKETLPAVSPQLKSSAAFGEVLLRKVELESSLEEMLLSYTEEYPKVKETRYELDLLLSDIKRLNAVKPNDAAKLTVALGKLIVKKAEVATNYWDLSNKYKADHPEVKRAKKNLEIYESAVNEIL
ncbi:MAG: hypothetical protein R2681_14130 [Pyrinomonadaceae bacterium]